MATTKTADHTSLPFESTYEQFEEFTEQMLSSVRQTGVKYLDSYEKAIDRAVDLELKLAGASKQEWLKTMIDAHADLTRELTAAYTSSARQFLR